MTVARGAQSSRDCPSNESIEANASTGTDFTRLFNEWSLRRILQSYLDYYHRAWMRLSLEKDQPEARPLQSAELGSVFELPEVVRLHHATNGARLEELCSDCRRSVSQPGVVRDPRRFRPAGNRTFPELAPPSNPERGPLGFSCFLVAAVFPSFSAKSRMNRGD